MQPNLWRTLVILSAGLLLFIHCSENNPKEAGKKQPQTGGYASQELWGKHLMTVGGCGDCHTPKKMTAQGPVQDSSLLLSGHPMQMPLPEFDRRLLESKGMFASQTLTFWMGPWGVSYAANLTPDSTGILAWTEEQFINCLRKGVAKGITGNRRLLPPMPWEAFQHLSDDELKAMFAYLQSIPPIKNRVPQPLPPVTPPPPPPAAKS